MDADKKTKVEEYINNNEQEKWFWKLAETVADLAWVEKETKESFLNRRLKNDENLLAYAELTMKTEKLNFWESIKRKLLEVKLSITCPYFADFKDFLEDLKLWSDISTTGTESTTGAVTSTETASESIDLSNRQFCWTSVSSIESEPFQKNSITWVTWCSKTARNNWKNFWIILPSWDAYSAGKLPWKDCVETIPEDKQNEQPKKSWKWIELSKFRSITTWNYADLYTSSKSNYGHRVAAFKDDSWQWYVLDPYTRVNWKLDNSPKKLEDYLTVRKIVKAHIYKSSWYLPDDKESSENPQVEKAVQWAINIAEDNCHWYEWWGKWENWQYDCCGFVNAAFKHAGFNIEKAWTKAMREEYIKLWFEWISPYDPNKLQRWDIVLKDEWSQRHTEIYTWNWKFVWSRSDKDWKIWDSKWNEIAEISAKWLTNFAWSWILRYKW